MSFLLSIAGQLMLLGLIISGLLLIVAPTRGHQLLRNVGVAAGVFLLGVTLIQIACSEWRG